MYDDWYVKKKILGWQSIVARGKENMFRTYYYLSSISAEKNYTNKFI